MKNKKSAFCLVIISVLLLTSSCSKSQQPKQESDDANGLYNYEVTSEPFESLPIVNSSTNYPTYDTEKELFDNSEIVLIGMPIETFTDGDQHFYDIDANEVDKNSNVRIFHKITTRNIKIIKVLKGDIKSDSVEIAENAIVETDQVGNNYIYGLPDSNFISKKNVKYIYYLNKGNGDGSKFYFPRSDQGVINIDGLDTNSFSKVSTQRLDEVKSRFAAEFAEYDRSDELTAK